LLQQPWFTLNPCTTVDLMAMMLSDEDPSDDSDPSPGVGSSGKGGDILRYMVAWLSLVGPVSGLCDAATLRALQAQYKP
jgi:hypothetical protein